MVRTSISDPTGLYFSAFDTRFTTTRFRGNSSPSASTASGDASGPMRIWAAFPGGKDHFEQARVQLMRTDKADPQSNEAATAMKRASGDQYQRLAPFLAAKKPDQVAHVATVLGPVQMVNIGFAGNPYLRCVRVDQGSISLCWGRSR